MKKTPNLKKLTASATVISIVLSSAASYAIPSNVSAANYTDTRRAAYLREDVTVELDREKLSFADENGRAVYPLTYNGSTYLPIRAVSGLMGEPIEWNNEAKTVYIGKTLSMPVKYLLDPAESPYVKVTADGAGGEMSNIVVREQRSIYIMYDFEKLEFRNESGTVIYPINYNGSNYLPLRAIAELMGEDIVWDGKTKTVYIGSMTPVEETDEPEMRDETFSIIELYDREAELYNLATAKIAAISSWTDDEARLMAASISDDLRTAASNKSEAKKLLRTETFTEEEHAACERLCEFIEITEYYILVMENIAYMAADKQDYSVMAETFLNFALESDKAMDAAREAIECL